MKFLHQIMKTCLFSVLFQVPLTETEVPVEVLVSNNDKKNTVDMESENVTQNNY